MDTTLKHFQHKSQAYQGFYVDFTAGEDEIENIIPVFEIEPSHPYFIVSKAFEFAKKRSSERFIKCFTDESEQNFIIALDLLRSFMGIKKYLAVPHEDQSVFVFDLWDFGYTNHEKRVRMFLQRQEDESYRIARLAQILPCDITIDRIGISESDEGTFEVCDRDGDNDIYPSDLVKPYSAFETFLKGLCVAREDDLQGFSKILEKDGRQYAFVGMVLMKSIKRIISFFEFRSVCIGLRDDGTLIFQRSQLDVTYLNFDGQLNDWQIDLCWNGKQWVFCRLNEPEAKESEDED